VGTKYKVKKFGAVMYDNETAQSSQIGVETTKVYDYTMPAPEGSFASLMKPKETLVKDRQLLAHQEQTVDASTLTAGVSGQITQKVETGFEINPLSETAPDELVFNFDLDAPAAAIPKGSRIVQWVTFTNPNNKKEKPMTLACSTLVGDPYVSHVLTWKGFTSMKDDSKVVKNKRYNKVNKREKTKKKSSFKLVQEPEWYATEEYAAPDGSARFLHPCLAKLNMGKKMEDNDPFFATYNVDMSVRVYASDKAKTFRSIATKTSTVEIKKPNTDLKSLYEEQQPETSAETVTYFDERFKFKLKDFYQKDI